MDNKNTPTICVITVTYGSRIDFLSKVMKALEQQIYPLEKVIVIDNNSKDSLAESLSVFDLPITIIKMYKNFGSAVGFKKGLLHGIKTGADLIWLLDDDNKPSPFALKNIVNAFVSLSRYLGTNKIALSSNRIIPGYGERAASTTRQDRFLGFHLIDSIINHLKLQKIFEMNDTSNGNFNLHLNNNIFPIRIAPYGGLLISPSLIKEIGLPRIDFVTYGDDIEWTLRIRNRGGHLYRCLDSIIYDIDKSWWTKDNTLSPIFNPDTQENSIYYGIRNQIYIEFQDSKFVFVFLINGIIRLLSLTANFILYSKDKLTSIRRYLLLFQAIFDGVCGRLGHKTKYDIDT